MKLSQPAQSVKNSKASAIIGQELEPWQKPAQPIDTSKSVGKDLKPKSDPKIPKPSEIKLEPAPRGAESIQAVSAAKIPQSVQEPKYIKESSDPTYDTKIKHVLNYKYERKPEANFEAKQYKGEPYVKPPSEGPPNAGAPRLRAPIDERDPKINYNELPDAYIGGLIFNKYDDRDHNSSNNIRKIGP